METFEELSISIAEAAVLLGLKQRALEKLLREDDICRLHGTRGKGGQLRIDTRDLPLVEAAYKLIDLRVPRPAVRDLSCQAANMLRKSPDTDILLSYQKKANEAILAPDAAAMKRIIEDGVAAVIIDSRRYLELAKQRQKLGAPRRRGRPRVDSAYIERKLDASAALGDDTLDDVDAEIRRLSGE
jgi:hypothetical protein